MTEVGLDMDAFIIIVKKVFSLNANPYEGTFLESGPMSFNIFAVIKMH